MLNKNDLFLWCSSCFAIGIYVVREDAEGFDDGCYVMMHESFKCISIRDVFTPEVHPCPFCNNKNLGAVPVSSVEAFALLINNMVVYKNKE